jgi:murein DD-endopeptidase MepM/ murein hydrolase activator NlpD|tara:strand:+ start:250 stop:1038 length:789 start_codon:yes stop_codon:yes gene_type:complete
MNIANNSNCLYPLHSPYPGGVLNIQINSLYGEDLEVIRVGKKSPFICSSEFKSVNLISPIPLNSKERNIKIVFNNKTIKTIPLIDKDYRESRITIVDNNMVNPPQEILPRIRMEASIIKAAKNINTTTINPVLAMTMPTLGIESSEFGVRRFINGTPRNRHTGLDIAAPEGTNVYAPLDGLILLSEEFFYRGNIVYIDHGNGLISSFSHLQESFVKKNKKIKTGDLIGKVGKTGRVTGPHLHWEVSILGTTIDPKLFLKKNN